MSAPRFVLVLLACAAAVRPQEPKFRRVVVDAAFRSEGIAVADVNRDGRSDLLVGDFWYEAPDWKPHRIRKGPDYGDGAHNWSDCFCCFAQDLDGDGFPDEIVVGFPGRAGNWYRNPGKDGGEWQAHAFAPSICNESPQWVDLLGDGKKGLLCGRQPEGEIVWLTPGKDPTQPWPALVIAGPHAPGSEQFSHGIGCGDLDGDGRNEVIVSDGFWSPPADPRAGPWPFTKTALGGPCAQMYALDVDGDGLRDVVNSSAHARGVWWHRQQRSGDGARTFAQQDVLTTITQTHALCVADIDGDGQPDLVTGKRFWAHGPDGDDDPKGTPYLVWIAIERGAGGAPPKFVPHVIDDSSGVGTQFEVADVDGDGRLDIAVSNKKGVFLFLQQAPR
jgi:hypothetical protein